MIVFVLTAVGLTFLHYKMLVPPFWFTFAYLVAWILVFGLAFDFFVGGAKLSGKKLLLLTFGAMIISTTVAHSVWTIVTPRWSFSVSTDKSTYSLGENVEITVYLKNMGFITHSFKSEASDPIIVRIVGRYDSVVWFSSSNREKTVFSVKPNQILQRNFLWNQTGYANYIDIVPGEYRIEAEIPGRIVGVITFFGPKHTLTSRPYNARNLEHNGI